MKTLIYCGLHEGQGLYDLIKRIEFSTIYAFDANPDKIALCKEKFAAAGIHHINYVNRALTNENGKKITFNITEKWDASSSVGNINPEFSHCKSAESPLYKAHENLKKITVKTMNLGKFLKEKKIKYIDVLISDLQGYDFTVISTLKEMIDAKQIGCIQVEVENDNKPPIYLNIPPNKKSQYDELLGNNYEVIYTVDQGDDWWETDLVWKLKKEI